MAGKGKVSKNQRPGNRGADTAQDNGRRRTKILLASGKTVLGWIEPDGTVTR